MPNEAGRRAGHRRPPGHLEQRHPEQDSDREILFKFGLWVLVNGWWLWTLLASSLILAPLVHPEWSRAKCWAFGFGAMIGLAIMKWVLVKLLIKRWWKEFGQRWTNDLLNWFWCMWDRPFLWLQRVLIKREIKHIATKSTFSAQELQSFEELEKQLASNDPPGEKQ